MHEIVHAPFQQALKTGVIIILQARNVKKRMAIFHSIVPLTARAEEHEYYEQNRTVCKYHWLDMRKINSFPGLVSGRDGTMTADTDHIQLLPSGIIL